MAKIIGDQYHVAVVREALGKNHEAKASFEALVAELNLYRELGTVAQLKLKSQLAKCK